MLPAQVSFSPNGNWIVVTERNGNFIDVFKVRNDGTTSAPTFTPSPVTDTFGFVFDSQGFLVVTQADNGAASGTVSSYQILEDRTAQSITNSLGTGTQVAPCWIAITSNGKYVYTVNTGSATITALGFDSATGTLTLLNPVGGGGLAGILPPGSGPPDNIILGNDVLYVNVGGTGQIAAFTIGKGGSLDELFLSPVGVMPNERGRPGRTVTLAIRRDRSPGQPRECPRDRRGSDISKPVSLRALTKLLQRRRSHAEDNLMSLCAETGGVGGAAGDVLGTARAGGGAVYMMTNAADGNQLAVFARDKKGLLEFPVFYNTGGTGAGTGLGSQGSIAMDETGDTLYLVNAGDGSISVFDLTKKSRI